METMSKFFMTFGISIAILLIITVLFIIIDKVTKGDKGNGNDC